MRDDVNVNNVDDALRDGVREIAGWLPELLGGLAILLLGYIVARIISGTVRRLLRRARLNQYMHAGHGGNILERAVPNPTKLISSITFWIVMFGAVSLAVATMGVPALVNLVNAIYGYIPNIIAALLIFIVAGAVTAAVAGLVNSTMGDTPTGKIVMTAAPIVIMSIAGFMILNQLKIAPEIVTITYAALLGSAALGMALAFGLGGRDVASEILRNAYDTSLAAKPQARADVRQGRENVVEKFRSNNNRRV